MFRWVTLSLLCLGTASGGVIAFRLDRTAATGNLALNPAPPVAADEEVRGTRRAEKPLTPSPGPRGPVAPVHDDAIGAREELHLIEEASAAVSRGDFASALPPLIEHSRRFKEGWLLLTDS